jgi:hypothetical protein
MTESFWRNTLALETFNTEKGRVVQTEAKKKIAALDKKMPLDLVEQVYVFYLKEAPYELWPLLKKVRDEHGDALVKALATSKALPASFLRAAHESAGLDGLRRGERLGAHSAVTCDR